MHHPRKTLLIGGLLALACFGQAAAGPLEDAAGARRQGDLAGAEKILSPIAEQGDRHAQYDLGILYADPGPKQDLAKSAVWLRKAADQGYAPAQAVLGGLYAIGEGLAADSDKAVYWFRKAADQGDAVGQAGLATCYARGLGLTKDDKQAFAWFKKAAEQRLLPAQVNLALMYQSGRGVAQDDVQALMWLELAADHPTPDNARGAALAMTVRDRLAAQMPPARAAEAKRLAAAWVAEHPAPPAAP